MPALKDTPFYVRSDAGQTMNFKCKTTVNNDGIFALVLPENGDLMDVVEALLKSEKSLPFDKKQYTGVMLDKGQKYYHVKGPDLNKLIRCIRDASHKYMEAGEASEMVIRYKFSSFCHYVLDQNGNAFANGYDLQDNGHGINAQDAKWEGSKLDGFAETNDVYFIGIGARVQNKITSKRGDAVKIKYEPAEFPGSHFDNDTYGKRLNGLCRLHISDKEKDVFEIPYTEEAARFFYDFIMGVCKMHNRFAKMFNADVNIQDLISSYNGGGIALIGQSQESPKNEPS